MLPPSIRSQVAYVAELVLGWRRPDLPAFVAILLVRIVWPEGLQCFALTAIGIYLVHRFFEAIVAGSRQSPPPGNSAPTETPDEVKSR